MASKDIINPVGVNNPSSTRRSADLLPGYHRTDKNTKFLASTLDQYIQQPQLKRVSGFMGSKLSLNYNPTEDQYIAGTTKLRNDYQLEPSMVISDVDQNIDMALGYDDLINQLSFNNAYTNNLDRLFRPQSYSYDPMIDWDKFVNFRQYYWLPTGPDTIEIVGQKNTGTSTYTVKDSEDGDTLIFTPDGGTTNPLLTLYRGQTYVFNVTSNYPFYIKTAYTQGATNLYSNVTNNGTKIGQVILTVDEFTPKTLFYFAEGNGTAVGKFSIKAVTEDTKLDIEKDILGKQNYTSSNGVVFSNGMKVRFAGAATPSSYIDKEWIVEGVGNAITLTDFASLKVSGSETTNLDVNFDATPFDQYPFDDFSYVPLTPDYITINKAALDSNPWSRYNRWVHADVISATAKANGVQPVYPSDMRASRPIIEYVAGLQLYNYGATAKTAVDFIDNSTVSAFKTVEGSNGYYIDGMLIEAGNRVIFNADSDPLIKGRIYEVKISIVKNKTVINLEEVLDTEPLINQSVVVLRGDQYAGTSWWFDGIAWQYSQQKTSLNQAPLWELYDADGNRYADQLVYKSSFTGTKLFGYATGTGAADSVLGFPLKYRNVSNVGEYLFDNYYMTDTFTNFVNNNIEVLYVSNGYLKFNTASGSVYKTPWVKTLDRPVPILQYQVITADTISIEITSIFEPGYAKDLTLEVFINDVKQIANKDYIKTTDNAKAYIVSTTAFSINDRVLIKLYTARTPINNGYYEPPINLTNNPLNGSIKNFTFSELSDHVKTIVDSNANFSGKFPGTGNLRDLSNLGSHGTRLVSHANPLGFAHYFLGTYEDNLIDSIRTVSDDYNQFKTNLLRHINELPEIYLPAQALDQAMIDLNASKDNTFNYNYSDMLAYGNDRTTRVFSVSDPRNVKYNLATVFNDTVLSERAVLVYLNNVLLIKNYDYTVSQYDPSITILAKLSKKDIITVLDYPSTVGSYIPPTPTKLGLYPKFKPQIIKDNTYVTPQYVIQGHDGSLTIARGTQFTIDPISGQYLSNDYRDQVLLEYEIRVYNNLKVSYNSELMDINSVFSGAFRTNSYSQQEINNLITPDFLKWTGFFGVDYQTNSSLSEANSFTYNYTGTIDTISKNKLSGFWRGIYKYFYDTDRPHTHPWEMLGFTEQPTWWVSTYGPAPYTRGNLVLWKDLEDGRNAHTGVVNHTYARPGLTNIIPVDDYGNLVSPAGDSYDANGTLVSTGLNSLTSTPIVNLNDPRRVVILRNEQIASRWQAGDHAPAETAWRRSSYWPFVCQVLLALTKPADYAALMFDTSRMKKNLAGEYKYGDNKIFLNPSDVLLFSDVVDSTRVLAAGYSVFVIETGTAKNNDYLSILKNDLANLDYRLMAKLGGFASKDKLQVGIDAVDPTSPYPGVLIPSEDYQIFFNKSSPIESLSVSGFIVQKTITGYSIRGYDKYQPYFTIFKPFASNSDQVERVGGVSESFVNWAINTTYNAGQVVFYSERYYRVTQKHNSDTTFNIAYYQSLPYLPIVGGVGVSRRVAFDTNEITVPYGVEYTTVQEVYDLIVGYGKWLESKGFVFEEYNSDLDQVLDWRFSAKEFLYWTTQNWSLNSVITLSPFANKIIFRSNNGVVESIVNNFYEYSLLKADGAPFPKTNFTIVRLDGEFTLTTVNTQEGVFFARLNVTQKEHAVVLKNFTLFNDVVYDIETGYRQRRIQVKGFITDNWNGDFFSPGFVFDQANITNWTKFTDYSIGDVVRFSGNYYSAIKSVPGAAVFDITKWATLSEKPTAQLLPNFDYKINQFEDFYSLDIDNFDIGQQAMAQHLTGYTPRPYLNYIIGDPIAQYKFYQGFIRDKGTKNSLVNLSKASLNKFSSSIDFNEEWAFRIGYYGGYNTYQELETNLEPTKFIENPQIINFLEEKPVGEQANTVYYKDAADVAIKPEMFDINQVFSTTSTSYADSNFILPVAGYVRFDDITATAYNKNSLLDIANNKSLSVGTTIWLGFKEDGEWDVLRVTEVPTVITGVSIYIPGQSIILTSYYAHQLSVGDLISVTGVANGIDQCYIVQEVLNANQFVVFSTLTSLPSLPTTISGLLFAFKSSRLTTFNDLAKIPFLDRWNYGEKVWVDDDGTGKWVVYKKINNYSSTRYKSEIDKVAQHYGSKIASSSNTNVVIVSSPDYQLTSAGENLFGRAFVLYRDTFGELQMLNNYTLNDDVSYYTTSTSVSPATLFGSSLAYNDSTRLVVVGAPETSRVKASYAGTNRVNPAGTPRTSTATGVVKLSLLDSTSYREIDSTQTRVVISTNSITSGTRFGTSLALSDITTTSTQKLLVGAPGESIGTRNKAGKVYYFNISVASNNISVSSATQFTLSTGTFVLTTSSQFGYEIAGNKQLTRVAVSAPGYTNINVTAAGAVFVYNDLTAAPTILTGEDVPVAMRASDLFGTKIKMTADGAYLAVASPDAYDPSLGVRSGVVDIFKWDSNKFKHNQRISAPISILTSSTYFGWDLSFNESGDTLIISSVGTAKTARPTFDNYVERYNTATIYQNSIESNFVNDPESAKRKKTTTFDGGATLFSGKNTNSGTAQVYNRLGTGTTQYAHAQELITENILAGSMFGSSVFATNDSVYVGAPAKLLNGANGANTGSGQLFVFDKLDTTVGSWELFRYQEPLVDLTKINRAVTIDSNTEQVQSYIDIIDPIKGRILGTAAEDIRYTTSYDPAIYSLGITGVNIDPNTNWLDDHVGDLWWDLSTVKYVWYEQGELEYRKNNWNNIFPGSFIDVYEWVRSEYLPSEWAQLADSTEGLTKGVSGQPKFNNNSVVSVKQVYNSVSNSFTNIYYYWVKNKSTVPTNVPNRRKAAFEIAQEIANPVSSGAEFLAIISPTSMMLANAKPSLASDQINLNIGFDYINDAANRHTEWTLIAENDPNFNLTSSLQQKLTDSLLGRDSLGNPVPDPALADKLKYGVQIRPRQSMFKDRKEALRNLIEFINSILIKEQVTGQINFDTLNSVDEFPLASTYDTVVDDIYNLELIPTQSLVTAITTATIDSNGRLASVEIIEAGFGYLTSPTITIVNDGVGAEVFANIDEFGSITTVDVINAGYNYIGTVELIVRPYTVLVKSDLSSNGLWAIYEWNPGKQRWIKTRTQSYNTTLFWKYIDWASDDYDPLKNISTTVASPYVLNVLVGSLVVGDYVKVQNGGDGRYLILSKTNGTAGTFDSNWNLVYAERGTIQLLDTLWNTSNTLYSWDEQVGFDQTEYDTSPDKELEFIIAAVQNDIFTGDRYKYLNQLWFKSVRYALSEQKFLDWAFKTTFISVTNKSGTLDQPATYKLENVKYYESFLKEIKPYHTKIRAFKEEYTSTELTQTFTSDFDLPSYYNTATQNFNKVEFGNDLLLQYPWKSWYKNYAYGVETIDLYEIGSGYTTVPTVTIVPAMGDTGHGATAVAYISQGRVTRIIVTNPGQGYTATPTVVIAGGGSTTLTPAKAYAQLGGSPVRANTIRMRFDRITGQREIGNQYVTDTFTSDGRDTTYPLSWVPVANKDLITLTRNGLLQLIDAYTIVYSTDTYNPQPNTAYTKKYAVLKLSFIPDTGDVIEITYPKSLDLYTASDRIQDYYTATSGMPGYSIDPVTGELDLSQLMTGVEYAGLTVTGLPFNFSGGWEATPYASTPWDNYGLEDGYTAYRTTDTSTQTFKIYNLINVGTEVNVYIKTQTDKNPTGQRVDGSSSTSSVYTLVGLGTGVLDRIDVLTSGTGYKSAYTKLAISAPNTLGGTQATASLSVTNGTISGFTIINPGSGYTEAPIITITEAINPSNSTSTVTVPAIARAVLRAEFTTVQSTATTSTVTIPASVFTTTSTLVTFRYSSSDGTVTPTDQYSLDAVVNGGDLAYTTALGIRPSEIVLDGGSQATRNITGMNDDGFLNPINSYAPEECVPGQVQESLGISVYAQPLNTSPTIVNKRYWINNTKETLDLGIRPSNTSSVIVVFNDQRVSPINYDIDYENNTFTFKTSFPGYGWLSLTSMQIGAVGLLDTLYVTTSTSPVVLTSLVPYTDVGSVYVTVNGVPQTTSTYTLSSYRKRARLTVTQPGTVQAYLFKGVTKSVSEISEQIIPASLTATTVFNLIQPPGNVGPFHSQVIVTNNGLRLKPPITTYYQASSGQTKFDVSKSIVYPSGTVDVASLEVYVNGTRIPSGEAWSLTQVTNQIEFADTVLSDGDAIAIVVKIGNEYLIENNQLVLTAATTNEIRITTFTNHDPDFIRTERFIGNAGNQYTMQRPILNSAYVWVTYNGVSLTANIDYTVDADGRTVVIRDGLYKNAKDTVVVTSFADTSPLIAYRIFRDMLGRTHYKRLSAPNTTKLAQDLLIADTMIAVEDSSLLTIPDPSTNRPGVILVDRERIEFFEIRGNTLHQLLRSTLGTSPASTHFAGTDVIDQGTNQTVPFTEEIQRYTTATTTATQQYDLSSVISFNTTTTYTDQVEVRYQGMLLLKPGLTTVRHDFTSTNATYDTEDSSNIEIPYGFTITPATSVLNLNFVPAEGARLEVIKRSARTWYNTPNTTLSKNTSVQAKFLLEKPAVIPAWMSTSSYVATDIELYLEPTFVLPLQDENGNPLEGI
jgi:hypothetical protein